MLSPTALLISSLTLVAAFKVPEGQANGVYRAYYNAEGQEVHELLTPEMLISSPPEGAASVLQRSAPAAVAPGRFRRLTLLLVISFYCNTELAPSSGGRRTGYDIYCGCGFTLDPGDCDAVVANLKAQFGSGYTFIQPRMSYYSIMGRSVVAFVCNYSGSAYLGVSAQTYGEWLIVITAECGRYIAGSEGTPGSSSQGYMRSGSDFCANALTSPAHHC
ncbi:hypothetical protein MAPG_03534 [Magnaporthiopsis poae ATCC 64411]|uniref:Ecp2 effector protein domain-containing protein n=1 Tax=Magnaporthiopsis poae (strain ATCC 64411 / 73-15) TaxID=644358 RepID=A0A0C4DU97_MAGP6|nr:hypothetical protein MAPG_03534 [Magnaporthiopsis poae ATCC 64411]